jgi:hypothetical protein
VLRGRRAWWIRRVDGERRLDPTHVREYGTLDDFRAAIEHPKLRITALESSPLRFPGTDLVLRTLAKLGLISNERLVSVYANVPWLTRLRAVRMRVPGYWLVEAAGTKRSL